MRMIVAPSTTRDPPKENDGTGCLKDALLPPNDRRKVELDQVPASETPSVLLYNVYWLLYIPKRGRRAGCLWGVRY